MAVKLILSSGIQRIIDQADAARVDGGFFIVSRWHPEIRQHETVLTLRARDVVGAEVLKDGVVTEYVPSGDRGNTA